MTTLSERVATMLDIGSIWPLRTTVIALIRDLDAERLRLEGELLDSDAAVKEVLMASAEEYGVMRAELDTATRIEIPALQEEIESLRAKLAACERDAGSYRKLRDVEFDHMTWDVLRTCSPSSFPTLIDDYQQSRNKEKPA